MLEPADTVCSPHNIASTGPADNDLMINILAEPAASLAWGVGTEALSPSGRAGGFHQKSR